jgi:hypothetical protein
MAAVSGPVSTLPGARWRIPTTRIVMCDAHPEIRAIFQVQGETDSFGAEYADLCAHCVQEFDRELAKAQAEPTLCDWCLRMHPNCKPYRDLDEGLHGPVYHVCEGCRAQDRKRFEPEPQPT